MTVTWAELEPVLARAKTVAHEFYQLTGKPLGITGEVGEYWAAKLLNLQLADARTPGYDALDQNGKRIQIKARLVQDVNKINGMMGAIKLDTEFDSVMLVLLQNDFEPVGIYEATRAQVEEALVKTDGKARQRGVLAINEFKRLGVQRWPETAVMEKAV